MQLGELNMDPRKKYKYDILVEMKVQRVFL